MYKKSLNEIVEQKPQVKQTPKCEPISSQVSQVSPRRIDAPQQVSLRRVACGMYLKTLGIVVELGGVA
jgi:hypothetical protein